jgi:hypothetical protein
MDGLTCSLTYKNGILVSAETRGNGSVGENILHNAMVIPSIPKRIKYKGTFVVDGEIICTYENFKAFENDYSNPRNFAAGSIRLLDNKECEKRNLTFVAWDWIKGWETINWLVDENLLSNKLFELKESNYSLGYFKLKLVEYIPLAILGIFVFFTVGDFVSGLISIENMLFDAKYIFLLLWVLTIPTINLLSFVFKVEQKEVLFRNKMIYLSSLILINMVFGLLLLVFEMVDPNFIVQVGKPLFPITFSVSIPIEKNGTMFCCFLFLFKFAP